jgi:hypothetical protein
MTPIRAPDPSSRLAVLELERDANTSKTQAPIVAELEGSNG